MDKKQEIKRLDHAKNDLLKVEHGCHLDKLQKDSLNNSLKSINRIRHIVTDDTLNRHFAKLVDINIRKVAHDINFGRSMQDAYNCLNFARKIVNNHLDHKSVVYQHVHFELYGIGSVEDNIKSTNGTGSNHDITPGAIASDMVMDNLKTIDHWLNYKPSKNHLHPDFIDNISVHPQSLNLP